MKIETTVRGAPRVIDVEVLDDGTIAVGDGAADRRVRLHRVCGRECWRIVIDDVAIPVRVRATETGADVILGASRVAVKVRRALPIPSRRAAVSDESDRLEVRAPMPGLVVAIPRAVGETVDAGSLVAVVEAMKMHMDVAAPAAGRIEEIRVRPGQEVLGGQVLVAIRVGGEGASKGGGP